MKSQLEEIRRKIIELLDKFDVSYGVNINHSESNIHVWFKRNDMPEGEEIKMTIGQRFGQKWTIVMDIRPRYPQHFPDEEKMLEFIKQELDKCCG